MHGTSDHREPYEGAATRRLEWPFMPSEAIQPAASGRCHKAPLSYKHVIPHRAASTRLAAHRLPIDGRIRDGSGRSRSRRR